MEMKLIDGRIVKTINGNSIAYNTKDIDLENEYKISYKRVMNIIDGYEINKYSDNIEKDIYYLYNFKTNSNEIDKIISSLLNGNDSAIINDYESMIVNSICGNGLESIFWDVLNDVIIIIGRENLRSFLYEMEKSRWKSISFNSLESQQKYIEISASNVYKKVMSYS